DDGAGEGAAASGDERGVGRQGVGYADRRRVGIAGVRVGQRVGQGRSRGDRVGRIGGYDGQDRRGHHGGGDARSGDRTGLVAHDRIRGMGDQRPVRQRAGDTDDELHGAGSAGGERPDRPGDDGTRQGAAGGGADERSIGWNGVADHHTGGRDISRIRIR